MLAKPPPPSSSKRGEMENGGRPRVRKEEGSHVCVVRGKGVGAATPSAAGIRKEGGGKEKGKSGERRRRESGLYSKGGRVRLVC